MFVLYRSHVFYFFLPSFLIFIFLTIMFSASLTSWLLPSLLSLSLLISFFSILLSSLLHAIFLLLAPLLSLLLPYFSLLTSFSFSFIFSSLLLLPLQSFRYSTVFFLSYFLSQSLALSSVSSLSLSPISSFLFSLLFFTLSCTFGVSRTPTPGSALVIYRRKK